jgi:hypothetical protein
MIRKRACTGSSDSMQPKTASKFYKQSNNDVNNRRARDKVPDFDNGKILATKQTPANVRVGHLRREEPARAYRQRERLFFATTTTDERNMRYDVIASQYRKQKNPTTNEVFERRRKQTIGNLQTDAELGDERLLRPEQLAHDQRCVTETNARSSKRRSLIRIVVAAELHVRRVMTASDGGVCAV